MHRGTTSVFATTYDPGGTVLRAATNAARAVSRNRRFANTRDEDTMDRSPTPYVLGPDGGEPRWSFGTLTVVKATGALTGERVAVIEDHAPRGDGAPLHRHLDDEESFYVLEGEIAFTIGNDPPVTAGSGSFVHLPGGVAHAFEVTSASARYLIVTTPRHGRFYEAISDRAPSPSLPPPSEPDWDRIAAACQAFGVELLADPVD